MSYAIIRNQKYTKDQLIKIAPHNERVKSNYSNKNIDKTKSHLNYHIKKPMFTNYYKEFKRLKEENNLKGQLHKNSIYACEMIITSDKYFFNSITQKETDRYFKTAYDFICKYNNLGEENIISAVVHLDEETPHIHLVFIPVVDSIDKNGNAIHKIGGNDFWKKRNSYLDLQDSFYEYISLHGFKLERGKINSRKKHKTIEELKEITNFYETKQLEREIDNNKLPLYTSIKSFINYEDFTLESVDKKLLQPLLNENKRLSNEIKSLKLKISKVQKAINEYNDLIDENNSLKNTIQSKQREIDVYESLIIHLNEDKEKLETTLLSFGINLEDITRGQV